MAKANGKRSVEDADKVSADGELASCESKGARAQNCCCHHKATPRSEELQHNLQKRLNRAIGQLNGVKAMIDDNRYCGDVLTQLAAAESAVHSISAILLQTTWKPASSSKSRRVTPPSSMRRCSLSRSSR